MHHPKPISAPNFKVVLIEHGYAAITPERETISAAGGELIDGENLPLEEVLKNAPQTDGPFFKVPKIIGGDEDSAG